MPVLLYSHDSFSEHETGAWHPERPERLVAAERGAMTAGVRLERVSSPEAARADLERIHTPAYIDALERFCAGGGGFLDQDTHAGVRSWEAAIRSAGSGPDAVKRLVSASESTSAFLNVRPPGHHALAAGAMGFCLFNNVAITAACLVARRERVAIIDWDVHHGNGTQELLGDDPDVLYVSLHQFPFYPMTGRVSEVGSGDAIGTTVNIPLPAGGAGDVYGAAFDQIIVPVVTQFAPDWILVSAGFDAHADDPLAEMGLLSFDYHAFAARLVKLVPANRLIMFLEGGYSLAAITASVAASLRGFEGLDHVGSSESLTSPPAAWDSLSEARQVQGQFWEL